MRATALARETPGRIAILAGAILLLWLGGAIVGTLIGAYPTFNEAVWDSIWHMIDPGALGDDENTKQRALGVFLAIAGLVILAGAALTLFEELVERALGRLGAADPPLSVADHLLVIGENSALPAIVRRLAAEEPAAATEIVVLVPPGDPSTRQSLRRELEAQADGGQVSVVGGDLHDDGLQRVCAADAAGIVVLAPATGDRDATDLRVLGIGAGLATTLPEAGRPPISLQMNRGRNVDVVWDQFTSGFDALVEDRATAATIGLCLSHPPFAELFTGLEQRGSVLLLDGLEGRPFGSVIESYPALIPIGVARGRGAAIEPRFAPSPDRPVEPGERVIVLGDPADLRTPPPDRAPDAGGEPRGPVRAGGDGAPHAAPIVPADETHRHLLIIGWSDAAESLVTELIDPTGVSNLTVFDAERPDGLAERIGTLRPEFIAGRPQDPATLAAVVAAVDPSHILVAATADSDARAAFVALRLERHFRQGAGEPSQAPVTIAQQSSTDRARRLRIGLRNTHVVCAAELIAETVSYAAGDPEALAVWEQMANGTTGNLGRVIVGGGEDPAADLDFAALHRYLLDQGIAPLALARDGGPIEPDLRARTPIRPGDELLVVRRP